MTTKQTTFPGKGWRSTVARAQEGAITWGGWGLAYAIMIGWSLVSLFSIGWIFMTSFKSNQELFANVWALPKIPQWINYVNAWEKANMNRYFLNSIVVTTLSVVGTGLVGSMASYILARFRFRGNRLCLIYFLGGMAIPLQLILVPVYLMFNQLKQTNSLPALIAMYVTITLPFSIFVLTGFFRSLPRELEEAAVLDGASEYQVFWRVMFPLVRPGLVTVSIFNFLNIWNEYLLALFLLSDSAKMTVPVGLYNLRATQGFAADWVGMFAGLIIVLLPTLIVFLILQRRIVGGLTVGALKG